MNIVLQGQAVKLIDFDAAAAYGEPCHLKYSSSFGPPQLAQRLLQYDDGAAEHCRVTVLCRGLCGGHRTGDCRDAVLD